MGLYLHSHPIDRFFKRSIRLWSKYFNLINLINEYSILSSTWNRFTTILPFFHIHKIQIRVVINYSFFLFILYFYIIVIVFKFKYVCIQVYSSSFLEFRWKNSYNNARQSTPFVRTASIESLHLSFIYSPFWKAGVGSGLPIFINSRVSLNLKVLTQQVSILRLKPIKSVASTNFAISPLLCLRSQCDVLSPFYPFIYAGTFEFIIIQKYRNSYIERHFILFDFAYFLSSLVGARI